MSYENDAATARDRVCDHRGGDDGFSGAGRRNTANASAAGGDLGFDTFPKLCLKRI
jgi:hypothetical protein